MKEDKKNSEATDGKTEAVEKKSTDDLKKNEKNEKNEKETGNDSNKKTEETDSSADKVVKLEEELDSMKDLLKRRQADFENYKKRSIKLQQDYKKNAVKDFALDIIQINDDLLRAINSSMEVINGEACEDHHRSFVNGVSMISKRLEETLEKYSIMEIKALGEEFDPNFHEAVEIEMSRDVNTDTVTYVHQKGFRLDEFVVRSSKVKVAKPMPQEEKVEDPESEEEENEKQES